VRDIANMFFILILVYIALTVMFRADTAETMKRLAWVIVIALIINFSFFFVRVVIDAGNLLAVQFYNAIEAPEFNNKDVSRSVVSGIAAAASTYLGQGNLKDLTSSIMNGIGAQKILNTESFSRFQHNANTGFFTELITLSFIYIALGAILFILAAAFFTVGIKFIIRTAVLWLVLIAAPIAFIAKTLKQSEGYYKQWQDALIMHVFYPAVFLFIFYILTLFMDELARGGTIIEKTFVEASGVNEGLTALVPIIAIIVVKLGFVIALLYIGLKASEQIGVMGAQLANKIAGKVPFMGGLKSYGRLGGLAYQRTLGAFGSGVGKGLSQTRLGNTPILGRGLRNVSDKLAGAKFGGARSYKEVREGAEKWKKESASNLWAIQNKDDVKRLGELEEQDQKTALTGPLKSERDRLADRVGRFGKSELETFKTGDLERIMRVLKEGQLKNIKESDKFKAADIEKLENAWHEKSNDAPLKKANKQIDLLREIRDKLKFGGVTLHDVDSRIATGSVLNASEIKVMRENINAELAAMRDQARDRNLTTADRRLAERNAIKLQEMTTELKTLGEHLDKVPTKVGRRDAAKEIEVS
jgi:hypothetical protein